MTALISSDSALKHAIADGWDAIWNHGDLAVVDVLMAPGYLRETPNLEPQDREQFKGTVVRVRASFQDLRLEIDEMIGEGSTIATRWTVSGTHAGSFFGVPRTNQRVLLRGVTISKFSGDQVTSDWLTWDPVDMVRALGIMFIGHTPDFT